MLNPFQVSNLRATMSRLEGILAIVGVALAAPATLQAIFDAGLYIEEKIESYKEIDQSMERFKTIGITMARGLLQSQLAVIHDALKDPNISQDENLVSALDKQFRYVVQDIITAIKLFDDYPHGRFQKVEWTMVRALDGFESNQNTFFQMAQYIHIRRATPSPFKLRPDDLVVLHETATHLPREILPDSCIFIAQASYRVGPTVSGML